MAGGFKSPFAFWIGRAAGPRPIIAGYKSLLAFWTGGANAVVPVTTKGGRRSFLAFWMGGACIVSSTPPPPTPTQQRTSNLLTRKIQFYKQQFGLNKHSPGFDPFHTRKTISPRKFS